MNKKTQANKNTTGTMKQCNNSSVPVNNQCDSKRLLHSSALTTKAPKNQHHLLQPNNVHYVQKGRQGDSIGPPLNFCKSKSGMFLQKSPFQLLGLSHCQNAMMIWLYCHHAQNVNPQSGVALIDQSSSLTLNPLISRVLKQSYVANYQNQLTFALSKTKTSCHHNMMDGVQLQSFTIANRLMQSEHQANHELVLHKGTEFYSANWILYNLQQKLQARNSNIKRAMQELFDRATLLLDQKVLKGLTIKMSGRLSGRKQGMAKTVSKTIGVLPLSGLKQTVDYDQGFVTTKLGCLGIKVWVFY